MTLAGSGWGSAQLDTGKGNGALNHQYQTHSFLSPAVYASPPIHTSLYMGRPVDYSLYAVTDDHCIANQVRRAHTST